MRAYSVDGKSAAHFKPSKATKIPNVPKSVCKAPANDAQQVSPQRRTLSPQRRTLARVVKFWSDLFLVRPWLLVCMFWLASVLMITISLVGLSSPGREMVLEPVSSSIVGQPLSAPDAAAASRLRSRDGNVVITQRDPAATLPGAAEQSMPIWPLLVMVAVCAGGCMVMSRQRVLTEDSRRGRRRLLVSVPRPIKPSGLKKNRRSNRRTSAKRSASQVMVRRAGHKNRNPAYPNPPVSNPVSYAAAGSAKSVTVVPDSETSSLDWKEGSLAHKLDVRQTRSINSFL